jgi:YVTN family beta-propeller protein
VPIGKGAREVCVSPDGTHAYVPNGTDNTITAVDLTTHQPIATIVPPGMQRPDGCTVSPDSSKVYVTGFECNDVVIISTATNQVVKYLTALPKEPRRILFTPDRRQYYVSAEEGNTITIFAVRREMEASYLLRRSANSSTVTVVVSTGNSSSRILCNAVRVSLATRSSSWI